MAPLVKGLVPNWVLGGVKRVLEEVGIDGIDARQ